jgi:hypothetical protein
VHDGANESGKKIVDGPEEEPRKEVVDGPRPRSMDRQEKMNDAVGAYWIWSENSDCFDSIHTTFLVEVPVRQHGFPDGIEAKEKEVANLKLFDTFEEVGDEGQQTVGSRWVITKKEKHDGQKTNYKGRIMAKGFQEVEKPQSDSPTAMRESVKVFLVVAANEGFELESVDIRAAFLQSKDLDRDVYVEPPKDLKEGKIWKLKKPLYGLDAASRKFWLCVKEIFKKEGYSNVDGDEAFYFFWDDGVLAGMILTHVDDFNIMWTCKFVDIVVEILMKDLKVSKVEKNCFRFTRVDIEKTAEGIEISMEDYAKTIEKLENIRVAKPDDILTRTELQVFRNYTGKLSWLAANTCPDLAFTALAMSKRNSCATIWDLKKINQVVDMIRAKPCKVVFGRIGQKEDLMLYGFLMLLTRWMIAVSVESWCYWATRPMRRQCHCIGSQRQLFGFAIVRRQLRLRVS